ncbi:hypothetical protein GcC1_c16670o2 [Golovinomyces cichoracearum]|uniref:Secreted protein n=1 Tax=Golovinomyces cichoracearum TaxID=62708 RepID=A0A420IW10_9PEZI|nr:hypothetical protein GcC1_c16670o2 [Golovinomyces cichoracearum]
MTILTFLTLGRSSMLSVATQNLHCTERCLGSLIFLRERHRGNFCLQDLKIAYFHHYQFNVDNEEDHSNILVLITRSRPFTSSPFLPVFELCYIDSD